MSKEFILEATSVSQWQALVREAEKEYGHQLDETMESYLVFTLMRHMKDQSLGAHAMATRYLEAHQSTKSLQIEQLRDIGDHCLLLSGLFPQQSSKRLVKADYYVELGVSAYHHLSINLKSTMADLYHSLSEMFTILMDLLLTIRNFSSPALTPLHAYELWNKTNSSVSLQLFDKKSFPMPQTLLEEESTH